MLVLNASQLERARRRLGSAAYQPARARLEQAAAPLLDTPDGPPAAPPAGITGWNHDYFCPEHHAPLRFALDSPRAHRCMAGGELLSGEPYDATWWRKVNLLLAQGAYAAALLWRLGGDGRYLAAARRVLLDYAGRYPGYAVHGEVPYNGPGKANCQTLDEATWIIPLAQAYDLLGEGLDDQERRSIRRDLLGVCASFLAEHREQQLHNHACWIQAAIGLLGLVLDSRELLQTALFARWGLVEQLERGVLADGLWCELTPTYHFYAFDALSSFARLESPPSYELRAHPLLARMPLAGLRLLLPDETLPLFNDATPPLGPGEQPQIGLERLAPRLELALAFWDEPAYHWALRRAYTRSPRASAEALLYGPETLSQAKRPALLDEDFCSPASGIALLRCAGGAPSYVLCKNTPDGGEHDHMDRPGLYFGIEGAQQLACDLGTVPYGLPLHASWFKTTLAHNTVTLEGQSQPPPAQLALSTRQDEHGSWVELRCAWSSHERAIAYAGASFVRHVLVAGDMLLDIFDVQAARQLQMDYAFHWTATPAGLPTIFQHGGTAVPPYAKRETRNAELRLAGGPYRFLSAALIASAGEPVRTSWLAAGRRIALWSAGEQPCELLVARAPANPWMSAEPLHCWLARAEARRQRFVHLWDFRGDVTGLRLDLNDGSMELTITRTSTHTTLRIGDGQARYHRR